MKEFDYSLVKNPEYFKDGRMEAHSDHITYANVEEASAGETSYRHSLNGIWKFHYARNYGNTIKGFEREDYSCKDWDDIRVPAHIQMEGYDAPQYANVQYPWEGHEDIHPGEIPEHFNPVASYVKYFTVPEQMKGKRLFISFQGAESGIALWLNGQFVGYSEDSFTPSEFELTDYVKEGENKLAAQVFKWTASSWCEDQDFYRFSGIYRDVYLFTVPDVHVYDLRIRAIPDETLKKAELEIVTSTWGKGKMKLTLSGKGEILLQEERSLNGEDTCTWEIQEPLLWSAEEPNLYDLELEISDESGKLQEIIPEKVGFRRFEMKDGIMTLNGKRIVFKGVNRHEFSSVTGRHVSREELLKDIVTMKQNNINTIRTSHYPNDARMYAMYDYYGLYTVDEADLEDHANQSISDRKSWIPAFVDRIDRMVLRDRNHPCVVLWSLGNEPDLEHFPQDAYDYWHPLYELAHQLDPQDRPVTLVCCQNDYTKDITTRTMDIVCINRYYGWYNLSGDMDAACYGLNQELDFWAEQHKPVMMSEYGADTVAGLHTAGAEMFSEEFQVEFYRRLDAEFDKRPWFVGEFVWNFADYDTVQGPMRVDGNKKGLFTRDRRPKLGMHFLRQRWAEIPTFGFKE